MKTATHCIGVVFLVAVCALPAFGQDPVGPEQSSPPGQAAAQPQVTESAARTRFVETVRAAGLVETGAQGLAMWDEFIKEFPIGPTFELAAKQRAEWKERADRNLVRFGPAWITKDELDAKLAKVEALLKQAQEALTPDAAVRLFDRAAMEHPHLLSIPIKKATLLHKAGRMREYGQALGQMLRIDPNNPAARNNLGVLMAQDRQWSTAMTNIGQAAAQTENDKFLDNMDAVWAMAEAHGASNLALDQMEAVIQRTVAQLHKSGKHLGQVRWGNQWISEQDRLRYVRENREVDRKVAVLRTRIKAMEPEYKRAQATIAHIENRRQGGEGTNVIDDPEHYRQLEQEVRQNQRRMAEIEATVAKLKEDIAQLRREKHVPTRSCRLVLVSLDDGEDTAIDIAKKDPADPDGLFD